MADFLLGHFVALSDFVQLEFLLSPRPDFGAAQPVFLTPPDFPIVQPDFVPTWSIFFALQSTPPDFLARTNLSIVPPDFSVVRPDFSSDFSVVRPDSLSHPNFPITRIEVQDNGEFEALLFHISRGSQLYSQTGFHSLHLVVLARFCVPLWLPNFGASVDQIQMGTRISKVTPSQQLNHTVPLSNANMFPGFLFFAAVGILLHFCSQVFQQPPDFRSMKDAEKFHKIQPEKRPGATNTCPEGISHPPVVRPGRRARSAPSRSASSHSAPTAAPFSQAPIPRWQMPPLHCLLSTERTSITVAHGYPPCCGFTHPVDNGQFSSEVDAKSLFVVRAISASDAKETEKDFPKFCCPSIQGIDYVPQKEKSPWLHFSPHANLSLQFWVDLEIRKRKFRIRALIDTGAEVNVIKKGLSVPTLTKGQ